RDREHGRSNGRGCELQPYHGESSLREHSRTDWYGGAVLRKATAGLVIGITFCAGAVCARADGPPSAIAQYVESMPSASGTSKPKHPAAPLPKRIQSKLAADGATGRALNEISTSPAYGAPEASKPKPQPTPIRSR